MDPDTLHQISRMFIKAKTPEELKLKNWKNSVETDNMPQNREQYEFNSRKYHKIKDRVFVG